MNEANDLKIRVILGRDVLMPAVEFSELKEETSLETEIDEDLNSLQSGVKSNETIEADGGEEEEEEEKEADVE